MDWHDVAAVDRSDPLGNLWDISWDISNEVVDNKKGWAEMKIVSEDVSINIDFVETYHNTYDNDFGDLFSINAEVRTATFSGIGKNIWYSYNEFEQFINRLKILVTNGTGTIILQPPTEATEDYDLYGDGLNLRFSMTIAPHLAGYVNLGVYRPNSHQLPCLQMLHVAFEINSSNIVSLIADFESFKAIVLEDLKRRAKVEC